MCSVSEGGYDVFTLYSFTNKAVFSPDKPNWTAAAESVMTPKEVLPSKPTLSAAVQSPEVQKEKVHTTQASHQEMSVAAAVERVTLPPNLTEAQG